MSESKYYVLDGKTAKPVADVIEWGKHFYRDNRRVAEDDTDKGRVSTVFLGLDHAFGSGPPEIFETMVFGGDLDGEMERYSTWEQAEAGHKAMVAKLKEK
jgi:hypothetical protein